MSDDEVECAVLDLRGLQEVCEGGQELPSRRNERPDDQTTDHEQQQEEHYFRGPVAVPRSVIRLAPRTASRNWSRTKTAD